MSGSALKLRDAAGGESDPSVDMVAESLEAMVPTVETISVGSPPFAPRLVEAAGVVDTVRRERCVSGWLVTAPMATGRRARWTVGWGAASSSERQDLLEWLRDTVQVGANGSRFAFDLDIDGSGTTTKVRFTGQVGVLRMDGSDGGPGSIEGGEVEEVI